MRRSLSKLLSILMFISIITPSSATVFAADKSTNPIDTNITITNNAVIADTIKVTGLLATDVIKVYSSATGGSTLGSATVLAGKTEVLISVPKLPADSGSVYVTRKIKGMDESDRTPANYEVEATSTSPTLSSIKIANNATGKSDTITVSGLIATDVVKVYSAATDGLLLGTAKVLLGKMEATVTRPQLGVDKGSVYVSVSRVGKHESNKVQKEYAAEPISEAPKEDTITVTNNSGIPDSIKVTGLLVADVVKVYSAVTGGVTVGTATVSAGKSEVLISVSKLPADSGSVYVTRKSTGMNESARTPADYGVEGISTSPNLDSIAIINNATGKSDTITVSGLVATDVIKVYSSATGGILIGTAKVPINKTEAIVINPQLGVSNGSVYVSISKVGKQESTRVKKDYNAELISEAPKEDNITITNNAGIADSIKITGLLVADVVKAYPSATGGVAIGTATVLAGKSEVLINVSKLPAGSGTVYITRKSSGMNESTRTPATYAVEAISTPPAIPSITVVNNITGKSDTVTVSGLVATDVIKVYSAATDGILLGTAKVSIDKTEATVITPQLGVSQGSVYVSVSIVGQQESMRTKKDYNAEVISEAPNEANITITNNAGIADLIKVTELLVADVVKVYSVATGGAAIGTATVLTGKSEVMISISKLPAASGSLYITRKSTGMNESARTPASYGVEPISPPPVLDSIVVVNNVTGKPDTITVTGLVSTDVINVYSSATAGTLLGTAKVPTGKAEITATIPQLGVEKGSVYVSISRVGMQESSRTEKEYLAEVISSLPAANTITVTNNSGTTDTVKVIGLMESDVVKVYTSSIGGVSIGKATVSLGKSEVLINVGQLPADLGNIYVTITSISMNESSRTLASYEQELKSNVPIANNITVTNNSRMPDTIDVTGLVETDVVKVYSAASGGTLLGSATVAIAKTNATISTTLIGSTAGTIYVTVSSVGKQESVRTAKTYSAEVLSSAPVATNITVTNNSGIADIINVTGLVETDIVKVYSAASDGTLLGSATVATTKTSATISTTLVGSAAGTIYVTVSSIGKQESVRTAKTYSAEVISSAPLVANITITNNARIADIINVTGLVETDVVKVYSAASGGTLLGKATVSAAKTDVTISMSLISSTAGTIYVTVSSIGKQESVRTAKTYTAEVVSDAPLAGNITVNNSSGIADSIDVTGLTETDVVKVYSAASGGTLLGSATVTTAKTNAIISITLIGSTAGTIYVTVSSVGKQESVRTVKTYSAEVISSPPVAGNITVTNNAGISDIIKVTGLVETDVVKVYSAASGGTLLGSAAVAVTRGDVSVNLTLIGSTAGTIYITVSSVGKQESVRVAKTYNEEATTNSLTPDQIIVTNNGIIADTITVTGVVETDVVKVYSAALGGTLLGSATVAVTKGDVSVSISQLSITPGSVYVSVTSLGKKESERIEKIYNEELTSDILVDTNIIVTNNAGLADTIKVIDLTENDVVKVYSTQASITPIATATVATGKTDTTAIIPELGINEGYIYVTVTKLGKLESSRVVKDYVAEGITDAISAEDISVEKISESNLVTIKNLLAGDLVSIYSSASNLTPILISTVPTGQTTVNLTVQPLVGESMYLTVKRPGKLESLRIIVDYL